MKGFVNLTHTNNKKINDVANRVSTIENTYAKKDDISNVYKYKGSVQNYSDLPTVNNAVGDTYNVVNAYLNYPAGTNFAWDGTKFDALGGSIDFSKAEFSADKLINVLEDTDTIVSMKNGNKVRLHVGASIVNKLNKTLVVPMAKPSENELVGIDNIGSQIRVEIGDGLSLRDNVLSAISGGMSDILSLDSDQMDNYMADGGLTNGQLAVCKKVITNGYIEGGVYRFEIQYPNTYGWVEIGATKLVSDINTILEDIVGV